MKMIERRLIAIYLEDHWAGATGGVELARRLRSSNRETEWSGDLEKVCVEVEEDRETLRDLMKALGVRRNLPKAYGAWAFEKVGRFKLNGRLTGYSPLSRVVELDGLVTGISGKVALWVALLQVAPEEPRLDAARLERLRERGESQRASVEELRERAAREAFTG
jgi:hypothetical protein